MHPDALVLVSPVHSSFHALQGFHIKHGGTALVGALLRLLAPNVATLELEDAELDSQLLTLLCAGMAPIKLQELFINDCVTDSQLLPTLGLLQHLRVLHFECSSLYGEHDVSPLAQLKGLQELSLDSMEPVGLSSVLSACTQLRELTVPYAHHITPELCSTSLTMLTVTHIIMIKPFLLDVGRLPNFRALRVMNMILCDGVEQGRLPRSADIVEQNARMLSSLPAAVEVKLGDQDKSELWFSGFYPVQESGVVVESLLGRLGPLATLPAARGLRVLTLGVMHILPGSIATLSRLFPDLRVLLLGSEDVGDCILSPQALFEACVRFPVLEHLIFAFRLELSLSQMVFAACAYVQATRGVLSGSLLKLRALLPASGKDKGERAAFEGLQSDFNALFPAGSRKVELVVLVPLAE